MMEVQTELHNPLTLEIRQEHIAAVTFDVPGESQK